MSRVQAPRAGWIETIGEARAQLEDKLTPTLRRDAAANLAKLYERARAQAKRELEAHGETDAAARLPATCPYALAQLIGDWWPEA